MKHLFSIFLFCLFSCSLGFGFGCESPKIDFLSTNTYVSLPSASFSGIALRFSGGPWNKCPASYFPLRFFVFPFSLAFRFEYSKIASRSIKTDFSNPSFRCFCASCGLMNRFRNKRVRKYRTMSRVVVTQSNLFRVERAEVNESAIESNACHPSSCCRHSKYLPRRCVQSVFRDRYIPKILVSIVRWNSIYVVNNKSF